MIPSFKPTLAAAEENLQAILRAAQNDGAAWRRDLDVLDDYPDYAFIVQVGAHQRRVLMPGCPLDVLMHGLPGTFFRPSIVVDGSSWMYPCAISFFDPQVSDEQAPRHLRSHLGDRHFHRLLPRTAEVS